MFSLKDIPFIDSIMPVALAILAWFGLNFFIIAPNIIAPRLTDNIWHPACTKTLNKAQTAFYQKYRSEIQAYRAAERAKQQQVMGLASPLLQLFGEEVAQGLQGLGKAVTTLSEIELRNKVQQRFAHKKKSLPIKKGYCGCVISETLQDRTDLALYAASLRFWEPASIQPLNQLNQRLIASQNCGNPAK